MSAWSGVLSSGNAVSKNIQARHSWISRVPDSAKLVRKPVGPSMVAATCYFIGCRTFSGDHSEGLSGWLPLESRCLAEIILAVQWRHSNNGYTLISRRTQYVSRQDIKANAIRGYTRIDAYLHRELGYCLLFPFHFSPAIFFCRSLTFKKIMNPDSGTKTVMIPNAA